MTASPRQREQAFQQQVLDLARLLGWKCYHTHDSRRSVDGFPDLVGLKGGRKWVAELKVAGRKPTPAQVDWLQAFEKAGVPAYRWTPDDWAEIQEVLGG